MKIAFLCSTFEPGRDGVGDYVDRFASFLSGTGHSVQVVALADRFAAAPVTRATPGNRFELVRIPASAWFGGDTSTAEQALQRFRPDWLSLQMVCYSYGRSGLLLRAQRSFARLSRFGRRHIMFHELWIGEAEQCGLQQRALGWLQKRLLLRLTRSWNPLAAHTSNPLYCELLRSSGIHAQILPLPGNIPIADMHGADARGWLLQRLAAPSASALLAGVFGALHPGWAQASGLSELEQTCRRLQRQLLVVHFGRPGAEGDAVWSHLTRELGKRVEFARLGELPAPEVSRVLQGLDLGIATSPWPLIGKSGTVASMLEHGLPTVVTRCCYGLRRGAAPPPAPHPLLYRFDDELIGKLARGELRRQAPRPREHMYHEFLASLEAGHER
jgi:glycosyltransferase involved in cell wall biosynthesis